LEGEEQISAAILESKKPAAGFHSLVWIPAFFFPDFFIRTKR